MESLHSLEHENNEKQQDSKKDTENESAYNLLLNPPCPKLHTSCVSFTCYTIQTFHFDHGL